MDEARSRLIRCFSAVFPSLSEEEIPAARLESVEGWDSVASLTLFAVIEEEFQVELDPEQLGGILSFEAILAHLHKRRAIS